MKFETSNLTTEFGKGFTIRNLRAMHQFYQTFPIRHTLRAELTWSHYRMLMCKDNLLPPSIVYICHQKRKYVPNCKGSANSSNGKSKRNARGDDE
jgi:hypothetical protein